MRRWLAIAVALLVVLPACDGASSGADAGEDAPPFDAAATTHADAAPPPDSDGGAGSDASAGDGGPSEGEGEYDERAGVDSSAARAACFDGVDNDSDGVRDCGDQSCQRNVRSCCVGVSSPACCAAGTEQVLAVTGCAGLLGGCLVPGVPFEVFGSPAPTVRAFEGELEALVPGGQDADGGAVLERTLDPGSGAIRLSATIASPLDAPSSGRVETLGVGFVDATVTTTAGLSRVAPIAGVVVSRNRGEVLLVIAGDVVQRWPLTSPDPITYTLELDPTGRVRLDAGPMITADVAFPVEAPVRAIVYGRTANPSDSTAPARLLDLRITPSVCDMPAALARSPETAVPAPGATWADGLVLVGEPDVLRYEDPPGTPQVRMALNVDGALYLAVPDAGGFALASPIGEPTLPRPTEPWAADGVSDPALVRRGDVIELLFTGWAGGRGTIARATFDPGTARFVVEEALPGLEASAERGFSALAPFDVSGVPHGIVRVDDDAGHRLALYRLAGAAEVLVPALRAPNPTDVFAYDRDEVDGPAVRFSGGVYRAYFSGRRGTRWSVGLLVSDDGSAWREPVPSQAVLSPSGAGFDALGVRDPAFDVVGGQLHVYYAGDDGERVRIGVARAR